MNFRVRVHACEVLEVLLACAGLCWLETINGEEGKQCQVPSVAISLSARIFSPLYGRASTPLSSAEFPPSSPPSVQRICELGEFGEFGDVRNRRCREGQRITHSLVIFLRFSCSTIYNP